MQQKVVSLGKDALLWEEGDAARNVAVVEKGKLGARTADGLVGVLWPGMVVGENALFSAGDRPEQRTASIVALEDGTEVTEYAAARVRDALAEGDGSLAVSILTTLVGQLTRNLLMVVSSRRGYAYVDHPLTGLMRGVLDDARNAAPPRTWETFLATARFLHDLRDLSDRTLAALGPDPAQRAELVQNASGLLAELVEGGEVLPAVEDFLKAEQEKNEWWARGDA